MSTHFSLLMAKDRPEWVDEVIRMAKKRASTVGWYDHQPEMTVSGKSQLERQHHSFAWSIQLDDLINEGCLAYLEALQRSDTKNAVHYARVVAKSRIAQLIQKEKHSHGFVRDRKTGRMKQASGIFPHLYRPGERVGQARINAAKTHCKNGHEFTPKNTYIATRPNGHKYRICKTCSGKWYSTWRSDDTEKAKRHERYLQRKARGYYDKQYREETNARARELYVPKWSKGRPCKECGESVVGKWKQLHEECQKIRHKRQQKIAMAKYYKTHPRYFKERDAKRRTVNPELAREQDRIRQVNCRARQKQAQGSLN